MGEKANIQGYLEYVHAFGSGFGYTADHFAKYNYVIAVEPNKEMLKHQFIDNRYEQIIGGIRNVCVI